MERSPHSPDDVAVMIKRHAHDVRNVLNGMELELTLLGEATIDPSILEAAKRLREAGTEINRLLQGLSSKYSNESPTIIPAVQVAERWTADARHVASAVPLKWNIDLHHQTVRVDPGLIRSVLRDVLDTAVRIHGKGPLQINCYCDESRALFEIAADECRINAGVIGAQHSYWAALRALAERAAMLIEPEALDPHRVFPIRLTLPLYLPDR